MAQKGVFWDSIDDEIKSSDLGLLPDVKDIESDVLEVIFDYQDDQYCDLNAYLHY